MDIFPLILYRLSVLPLPKDDRAALIKSLLKLLRKARWSVGRSSINVLAMGRLGMPDLKSHRLAERLAYLGRSLTTDAVWSLKVRVAFPDWGCVPRLKVVVGQGKSHHSSSSAAGPFETFHGPATSHGLVKSYIEG